MAKEHHCPNDGPQPCNASTSRIHTCGICNATWEEDLSTPPPPQASPPSAPPVVPPKAPTASPSAPLPIAKPASPGPATAAPKTLLVVTPAPPTPTPVPNPIAPAPPATPPTVPIAASTTASQGPDRKPGPPVPPPGENSTSETYRDELVGMIEGLDAKVSAAKVKTCPGCHSRDLAQPSQVLEVGGRIVLGDSQSYRSHWWFADTGEMYDPPVTKVALKASA